MLAVLELWLRRTPNAAWEVLVGALEEMGENRVAENIRHQYIRGSELQLLSLRDDCWTFDLWGSVPECFMHMTFGSTSEDTVKTVSICAAKICACVKTALWFAIDRCNLTCYAAKVLMLRRRDMHNVLLPTRKMLYHHDASLTN